MDRRGMRVASCVAVACLCITILSGCLAAQEFKLAARSLATEERYLTVEPRLKILRVGLSNEIYERVMNFGRITTNDLGIQQTFRYAQGLLTEASKEVVVNGKLVREDFWGYNDVIKYSVKLTEGKITKISPFPDQTAAKGPIVFSTGKLTDHTFESTDGAVRISVPSDKWLLFDSREAGGLATFMAVDSPLVWGTFYSGSPSMMNKPFEGFDKWVADSLADSQIRLQQFGYRQLTTQSITIGGRKTVKVIAVIIDPQTKTETQYIRAFIDPIGQNMYLLHAYVPTSELPKYENDLESIMQSILFSKSWIFRN